jgi:hypothetical protein
VVFVQFGPLFAVFNIKKISTTKNNFYETTVIDYKKYHVGYLLYEFCTAYNEYYNKSKEREEREKEKGEIEYVKHLLSRRRPQRRLLLC